MQKVSLFKLSTFYNVNSKNRQLLYIVYNVFMNGWRTKRWTLHKIRLRKMFTLHAVSAHEEGLKTVFPVNQL